MTLELKVGSYYLRRDGMVEGPMSFVGGEYSFKAKNTGHVFPENGDWVVSDDPAGSMPFDLITECDKDGNQISQKKQTMTYDTAKVDELLEAVIDYGTGVYSSNEQYQKIKDCVASLPPTRTKEVPCYAGMEWGKSGGATGDCNILSRRSGRCRKSLECGP
jgi:hypothetical protein